MIRIEPCPAGGVLLIASDGHALAVARDPDGSCTGPMSVDIPDDLLEACRPPQRVYLNHEGEIYAPEMPAWMIPGLVLLTEYGGMLFPKSKRARGVLWEGSLDKRSLNTYPDWRQLIPSGDLTPISGVALNPDILARFSAAANIEVDGPWAEGVTLFGTGDPHLPNDCGPIVVRTRTFPDFFGLVMPMRNGTHDRAVPEWLGGVENDGYKANP
jgi:hypothetical protein